MKKAIIRLIIIVFGLLLIPLILTMRDGNVPNVGWNWSPFDFVFAGVLLFGCGLAYEFISRKGTGLAYRFGVATAVGTSLLLIWVNAAVGIIGSEDRPVNLLYFGVILVGLIGTFISRMQPRGMAKSAFAAAVAQMIVPTIALLVFKAEFSPGVVEVFTLNGAFAFFWVVSGLFFLKSGRL